MRTWLLGILVAFGLVTAASGGPEDAAPILVEPVKGAADPFDESLARGVADALARLGYHARAGNASLAAVHLAGEAQARITSDGVLYVVAWTLKDAQGRILATFREGALAPYQATQPWDAFDADTLGHLAKTTALKVEKALQKTDNAAPPALSAKASAPAAKRPASNRTTRVFIEGVTGAPGDGDIALANALARFFAPFDIELLSAPTPGAYTIQGTVTLTSTPPAPDKVAILWRLKDHKGRELARIQQENAVPAGSLSTTWGKTAVYAAEGAADGLLSTMAGFGSKAPGG